MEETNDMEEAIRQVLSKTREEYAALASLDLLKTDDDDLQIYFARYSQLKQLISSIESYLEEHQKLQQLEKVYKAPKEGQ